MTRGRGRRRQRGMFLPALLVLGALGAVGWLLSHQTSAASRQLRQDMQTAHALAVAREALIGFAATYRSKEHPDADFGYLPCPDLDGDGSSETCGTKDQTSVGRLPYLTLNLPDLRDGAGECLWYAVAGSVKNNPKPDVLNWDSTGRFRLHDTGGTAIALPGDQTGLAAALVIAAGPPRAGQHRSAGPARCGGDPEARNIQHYVEALGATAGSGIIDVRPGTEASDDRVATITTGDIHSQLKRRASYGPYLQSLFQATAACLAKNPLPAVVAPQAHGPVELGLLPPLDRLSGPCRNTELRDAIANWAEMMRYARCRDGSDCLASSSGRCRGALIFGGERGGGQPRITPADRQSTANYLEAPTLAALAAGQLGVLPERIALPFASSDPAVTTDVALCIP